MRLHKKVTCLMLSCALLSVGMLSMPVNAVTKNGFSYNTAKFSSVIWKSQGSVNVYSSADELVGIMSYTVGVARYKGTKDYTKMIRMIMTPYNSKVKISKYSYGYGFSEYVSVSSVVPHSLDEYRPVNNPSSNSVNLSLGYSKDGASIGVDYSIVHNDLDITAKCDTPMRKYHVVYNYKPNIANIFASNKYLANESKQYGMAQFSTSNKKQNITYNFDARFGVAENNAASPINIYLNKVFKETKAIKYTFSF